MKIESSCNLMEIHLKFWLNIYHKRCWFIRKLHTSGTEQKIKFFIKDFFSKFDQIRMKLRIWSHLLKKSFRENFIFCAVKWTCKGNTYESPGRQMHSFPTYFLVLMPAGIVAKLHPIIWSCISLWAFSYTFLQHFKNTSF